MKKYSSLLLLGTLNVIHACLHLFQVIQSLLLASYSINHEEHSWIHEVMESPYMAIVWLILGIVTIYFGIRDYKHHKHHKD